MKTKQRIAAALEIAAKHGTTDGAHHKMWVIDQMVRALTGCPDVIKTGTGPGGNLYRFEEFGESQEYLDFVSSVCDGEDGPNTYDWETGIAP